MRRFASFSYLVLATLACGTPPQETEPGSEHLRKPIEEGASKVETRCDLPAVADSDLLSPEELRVVSLAEDFVAINGYTGAPGDPTKMTHEGIEFGSGPSEIFKYRHNTVCPRAAGIDRASTVWIVTFPLSRPEESEGSTVARGVIVNSTTGSIYMEHQDFRIRPLTETGGSLD